MKKLLLLIFISGILFSCNRKNPYSNETSKSTIYFNGDIITVADDTATYAEAVLIKDGEISFVGAKAEAEKLETNATQIDLEGKTLVPGFIDAHGHAFNAGIQAVSANLLPAPDGTGNDIPTLIQLLNEWKTKNPKALGKYKWIIGFGYDDAQLKEQVHPTADDLDKVSTESPVLIIHQSGHLGVMNHKALELTGYNANTKDPAGGVIRRKTGTKEPNGVLEEMAFFGPLFSVMAKLDKDANEKIALAGVDAYTRFGYTTVQEGRATKAVCDTWLSLGKQGKLTVDVACYPDLQSQLPYMQVHGVQKEYTNHVRIAGIKLSLDGSPQGRTAWLTKPYFKPPAGQKKDYVGYPAFPLESDVHALVDTAFAHNWQILAHCNGDASLDEYIRAIREAVNRYGNGDRRNVAVHAQTARFDQLDSMKVLKIIPSFFGMHTYYWGDWHRDVTLGKDRAYKISPAQTALKKGMIFTEHHDAPVALPSSIMIMYSVVNRISRSGDIIGPDERISPYDALRSITSWAAYQYFEQDKKGSIEKGKLADFTILDKNPLKVEPKEIIKIQVLETIKEGKSIYKKKI
ncbi:amidohydrolase [[Flexibacter] sp. ATCC 35208]|uniref:amidohydrolase n=1 Tax=[Flexibacter] sp. ATCC 35208 TaxID=1936242 RepID=UPI0009FA3E6C|nr:amidohydrolase [[Flexibacter] sp. ATCC 35208]